MRDEISAGQAMQLNKMDPEERMTVLASHDYRLWTDAVLPNLNTLDQMKMKKAFVAGFMRGMERSHTAFMKEKQKRFFGLNPWVIWLLAFIAWTGFTTFYIHLFL